MTQQITAAPLSADAFAPYGEVLQIAGPPDRIINDGKCGRYHDLALMDFTDGWAGISLFDATPRALPYSFDLVERHPDGSQAFIPMHRNPWLVIVAPDYDGLPGAPLAFVAGPGQGINFHRGTWHGVLTPLHAPGLFAVVDRIGAGGNLQEVRMLEQWTVVVADKSTIS